MKEFFDKKLSENKATSSSKEEEPAKKLD